MKHPESFWLGLIGLMSLALQTLELRPEATLEAERQADYLGLAECSGQFDTSLQITSPGGDPAETE